MTSPGRTNRDKHAEPYADPDGAYVVATLRDPDGNTLQLVEFGE